MQTGKATAVQYMTSQVCPINRRPSSQRCHGIRPCWDSSSTQRSSLSESLHGDAANYSAQLAISHPESVPWPAPAVGQGVCVLSRTDCAADA